MNSEVAAPACPVAKFGAEGTPDRASASVVNCSRARSAPATTSVAEPMVLDDSGRRVAVVMTGASWVGVDCARSPVRPAARRRRHPRAIRRVGEGMDMETGFIDAMKF